MESIQIPVLGPRPDYKRTYLRPQEELEKVLTIQIEPKFSALSIYVVSRWIPALLHGYWKQSGSRTKNDPFFVLFNVFRT